ncbi:uracil-DNA glycosylase family protein [Rhodosalinus sediminis]|uniref:uracil-DNA glycosylase family protein n=1 Tax=Rhodosalinus sediminis TaxID=1940533 RepID=UPI0023539C32|nr:uracil-DNA glycosylase family protein [Rhodosalinus sediminis]
MPSRLNPESLRERIEAEYTARGDQLGWRLLYSPEKVVDGAEIAFIGLNPGGDHAPPEHEDFAMPGGSAYVEESWAGHPPGRSPLQRQVHALFDALDVAPERVLAGNLVPFRAPSWDDLAEPREAIRFGTELWRDILAAAQPRLIVTMGQAAGDAVSRLLGSHETLRIGVGWGSVTARRHERDGVALVVLPHLSRFAIIGRPASEPALAKLFAGDWRNRTDRRI